MFYADDPIRKVKQEIKKINKKANLKTRDKTEN